MHLIQLKILYVNALQQMTQIDIGIILCLFLTKFQAIASLNLTPRCNINKIIE